MDTIIGAVTEKNSICRLVCSDFGRVEAKEPENVGGAS
ncbi:hypothetical protein DB29_00321 [Shouchella clausii]|nr:hypothetical protein DB29_00321 [Shouchella clausii]